jgi:nucleoside 2-deoxyribosyltransferase
MSKRTFDLPKQIERHLAALSKLYAQDGNRQFQEIIVNARPRMHEEWTAIDDFNSTSYGHALYLNIPEALFLKAVKTKDDIQRKIEKNLNSLHNAHNEFIAAVFLEMEVPDDHDWRQESGLLIDGTRIVEPDAAKRIWGEGGYRVFLSHKSEMKVQTSELKERLKVFGVSAFVAHEDIHPTQAWQDEIENALASMDAFVAVMTENFHESDWTDQEVGYAVARGVPIIAAKLGRDPYGFIGKFQAMRTTWKSCAEDIAKILIVNESMLREYLLALKSCSNFDMGNSQSNLLGSITSLTHPQIDELIQTYNKNSQLRISHGFSGAKPTYYGEGLVSHLNRLGKRKFRYGDFRVIELVE